jgi:hypothetical protein
MEDASDAPELPPSLRFLKWLVILLMITMIGGVISIVALLVTRLPGESAPSLPAKVELPAGEAAQAVTVAKGMAIIVTESGRVLVFAPDGTFRQELELN